MSNQTLACPQCHTALRSNKPLPPQQMVRCPHCGNHFSSGPVAATAELTPAAPAPVPTTRPAPLSPFILLGAAVLASMFVAGGGVAAVYFLTRNPPANNADTERLEAERKALAEKNEKLEAQLRQVDFKNYLNKGNEALAKKNFDVAAKAFDAALKLVPDDQEARDGLMAAKVALAVDGRSAEEKAKQLAQYTKFMEEGRKATDAKEWSDAVRAYESAGQVQPGDEAARHGLDDARTALALLQGDKAKQTEYQNRIDAAMSAMKGQRFADAVREYLAAQRVMPGDMVAAKGLADAEKKLNDLQDGDKKKAEVSRLVERARSSYKDKRFDDAVDSAQAALKLIPGDAEASGILASARQARTDAKTEYTQLIDKGTFALKAGQFEQAKGFFTDAAKLFPDDSAAKNGLRDVQRALDDQAAFVRLIAQGAAAADALKYGDAVRFYQQATLLNPNDVETLKELRRLRRLLEKDTGNAIEFDRQVALGKGAIERRAYPEAAAAFKKAVDLAPSAEQLVIVTELSHRANYEVDMAAGRVAVNAKRYKEAVRFFDDASQEIPNDPTALNQLKNARSLADAAEKIPPVGPKSTGPAVPPKTTPKQ